MIKIAVGLLSAVTIASLAANGLLYMRYSSTRPLIKVNDQVIRRKDLDDRVDYQYSNAILRQMIISDVINQTAAKDHLTPTAGEVSAERADILRSHPQLFSQALASDPQMHVFNDELETKLALRNLRLRGITVSNSEVASYYAQHKADFSLPQQSRFTVVLAKDSDSAATAQRLLQKNIELQVIAGQDDLRVVGINAPPLQSLPQAVSNSMLGMKAGEVKIIPVGSYFLVAKSKSVAPRGVPPLTTIEPEVTLAARLAKAPTEAAMVSKMLQESQIKVESDKYAGAVPQLGADVASAR